ncbi:MAG: iron-containing alcohol dehydrogenase [Clostridia bacterium]|nr:iron-containing alcohol dehydrogenase [Clostridia bacterium]
MENKFYKIENCSCGKTHFCDIEGVFICDGATKKLSSLLEKYSKVLVVADENTYNASGSYVETAISDKIVDKVIFSGDKILIPDEIAILAVEKHLISVDFILGIGSGVIQDLCKYVSHTSKIPYGVVATAPSMDGYCSDGSAMITGGMKVTYKAGLPRFIVAEPEVLSNAPFEMIQAGYGDIIGKYSALSDWLLARVVDGEYFCKTIYDKTFSAIENVISCADGLVKRDKESVKTLMDALIEVGIMMSFAGSSRPASGSEHHMAHYYEITGILDDKPYYPHGIDVGYSTVITCKIREDILSRKWSFRRSDDVFLRKNDLNRIYKSVAPSCEELQIKTQNYIKDRISIYIEKEDEIKKVLSLAPSGKDVERLLEKVGLKMSDYYAFYGESKISDGIKYSKDLKDRYTVFWLYYYFNRREKIDFSKIKVIAMDLDGTLTQHRQPLPKKNIDALKELSKKYKLIMVGAGQVERIFNQMEKFPIDIIGNYGMQYGVYNKKTGAIDLVFNKAVGVDKKQIEERVDYLRNKYGYTEFKGDSVEFHPSGCITFPILGTKADKDDKIAFDPDRKKRRKIYHKVCEVFSDYEVFVGGSSSFDMSPKGVNKYFALKDFAETNGYSLDEILFIGDDYGFGGNDEPVYLSNIPFLEIDNFETFSDKIKDLL